MAHPSKAARKARRRRQGSVQQRALEIQNQNYKLVRFALEKDDQTARLARLLATTIAIYGVEGTAKLPLEKLNKLPGTARVQELVDRETGDVTLMVVVDEDEAPSPIITPEPAKILTPQEFAAQPEHRPALELLK